MTRESNISVSRIDVTAADLSFFASSPSKILEKAHDTRHDPLRLAMLYAQWKLELPLLTLEEQMSTMIDRLLRAQRHQQMLCGHTHIAAQIPSMAHIRFIATLVAFIIPSRNVHPYAIDLVQAILRMPDLLLVFPEEHLIKMDHMLHTFKPQLQSLVALPLHISPTMTRLLQGYLLKDTVEPLDLLRAIFSSLLTPFQKNLILNWMLHTHADTIVKEAFSTLSKHSLPKSFMVSLRQPEEDFLLRFEPQRALFLESIKNILDYLHISYEKVPSLQGHPMCLADILITACTSSTQRPEQIFRKITRCYKALKTPPLLQLIHLQINKDDTMKILNQSFQIECDELHLSATSPKEFITKLRELHLTGWGMIKSPRHIIMLQFPLTIDYELIEQEGQRFLSEPVDPFKMSQMITRICENQITFNQKIKHLLPHLPLSKEAFCHYLLKESLPEEMMTTQGMIQSEFAKIFFNELICKDLIKKLPLSITDTQMIELIHELMLSIGLCHELPLEIARIIRKIFISKKIPSPTLDVILATLCSVSKRPQLVRMGHIQNINTHRCETPCVIDFHLLHKRPEFFIYENRHLHPIAFEELMNVTLIISKVNNLKQETV